MAPQRVDTANLTPTELNERSKAVTARRIQLQTRLYSLRSQRTLSVLTPAPPVTPPSSPGASQVSTIPDSADAAASLDTKILSYALSRSKAITAHTLSNLYRIAGVTTFSAREATGETLLGLRFEVFSRGKRRFLTPVYVLVDLKPTEKGGTPVFVVARHSAPAFLGVVELAGRYLPPKGKQDLTRFVREVNRRVGRWRRRVDAAERFKQIAVAVGKAETVEVDDEVALLVIKWKSGAEANCRVDERGEVVKVVVKSRKGARNAEAEGQMKGKLAGLAARLQWEHPESL